MEISERKLQILQAIIESYLETAEPVGSRTISKRFPLGISSATIRNEMADLEEMGLIEQPHTSAGRIPSALGYRLYVDQLMNSESVSNEQWELVRTILQDKSLQLDSMLKEIGDLLASVTRYTTIVTTPHITKTRLKHLQLVPLDADKVILVLVTDGNIVRNHIVKIHKLYTQDDLYKLTDRLNSNLCGMTVSDITLPLIQKIKKETKIDQELFDGLLDALNEALKNSDDVNVFTSGASNMLNFPEFHDVDVARGFMEFVQQKDQIKQLNHTEVSGDELDGDGQVKIVIGQENEAEELKNCSVITASFHYHNFDLGTISVVGPMRMDYDRVVGALKHLGTDFPLLFDSERKRADNNGDKSEANIFTFDIDKEKEE